VSAFNDRLAKDAYTNRATELACLIREFGRYRHLHDVPEAVVSQATRRGIVHRGNKLMLQTKDDYKKETGLKSPNEFDAYMMCLGIARDRLGIAPGGTDVKPSGPIEAGLDEPFSLLDIAAYNNLSTSYANRG
jgi:hypothetical protein